MADTANAAYRVETDGFFGELYLPAEDRFPGKALIAFSGSDGGLALTRALAGVFQARGLSTLALAYVGEEGLPQGFSGIPIEYVEAAAKRLHAMGYEKVGLWGISKGAELALTAGSLLPGLVNAVVAVAPMNTVCQAFVKGKGIVFLPGSCWSFRGQELPYSPLPGGEVPPGPGAAPEPAEPGDGHVRPLPPPGGAAGARRRHPGGGHHGAHPADFLENGHHVALGVGGGKDPGAAAGPRLPLRLSAPLL